MSLLKLAKIYLRATIIEPISVNSNVARGGMDIITNKLEDYLINVHKIPVDEFNVLYFPSPIGYSMPYDDILQPIIIYSDGFFVLLLEIEEYRLTDQFKQNIINFGRNISSIFKDKVGLVIRFAPRNKYPVM